MNASVWRRICCKHYFKTYYFAKINTKLFSTSYILCSKKQFKIKNKFQFQNELRKVMTNKVKRKNEVSSSNSDDEFEDGFDESNFSSPGFISADLLPEKSQKIITPQKGTVHKPSLTYKGEILYGVHPVYLALLQKKRLFHQLYTRESIEPCTDEDVSQKTEIIQLAKSMNIPISFVDSKGLKMLAPGAVHQGVCLDAGYLPVLNWNEDNKEKDAVNDRPLWLVLEELLDPMNVGAIIRSAHYFGVSKLFTIRGHSCKLSPTVSKASSGCLEVMDIYQIPNLEDFIMKRKDDGWCIVSTVAYSANKSEFKSETSISASHFNISKPTILILGNEGRGISQDVLKLCDSLISIEPGQILSQGIDSLNVSVAAGILLYRLSSFKNNKR